MGGTEVGKKCQNGHLGFEIGSTDGKESEGMTGSFYRRIGKSVGDFGLCNPLSICSSGGRKV